MNELAERLKRYYSLTERALKKVKIKANLAKKEKSFAKDFLDMAQRYFSDAKYFEEKKDLPTALAAVTYAHAWLDAGARIGLFETGGDSELFAAD